MLSLLLLISLVFVLTACSENAEETTLGENQPSGEEHVGDVDDQSDNKEEESVDEIPAKDLIEMRGSNLRLEREDLSNLSLDGEHYELPKEFMDKIDFSHIQIVYPLIFDPYTVYHLEQDELLFSIEDITLKLEEDWDRVVRELGEDWDRILEEEDGKLYIGLGTVELKPTSFNFIDNLKLSPSGNKVFFSVHHYLAAAFTTVTGVFDIESRSIEIVEGFSRGQVVEVKWSTDENNYAYITFSAGGMYQVSVVDVNSLQKTTTTTSSELFREKASYENLSKGLYERFEFGEWHDETISIELKHVDSRGNVKEKFVENIRY